VRGPDDNGMAQSDAPLHWSDTENIKWKAAIPGRGPLFARAVGRQDLRHDRGPHCAGSGGRSTTAVVVAATLPAANSGPQPEHKFELICLDKKTGTVLWQRTAKTAAPHEDFITVTAVSLPTLR